jgi:hypothetical protein
MPNYTKLFNSIVTSTIWTEDDKTRIVWITMLAIADQNGEVQASIPGLARLAAVSISDAEIAISKFLGPDPYSRTPENDGRRIAKIDGGWELLNHAKYRRMASLAEAKEANSERQRRHRERNASVTHRNASVTHSNASVTPQTDKAEAEAEAEAKAKEQKKSGKAASANKSPLSFPDSFSENRKQTFLLWAKHKAEKGQSYRPSGWKEMLSKLASMTDEALDQAVRHSMAMNYQGIFAAPKGEVQHQAAESKPKKLPIPANWREIAATIYDEPLTCEEDELTDDQRADIYRNSR